ncbi:Hypothetical predicted protein [Cloeon dipterum]|uniref:G-protein coupled receptors family 1 profile domain-containing protein n=1 Tax=Cloeon dipterum TaxID=197152 RepID=A0A8S1DG34_9INSE|nr:Hypothetical predicted protein [Cloeon dipterum]
MEAPGMPWEKRPSELPIEMQFNDGHVVAIVGFSILFVISAIGNIYVLYSIYKSPTKRHMNLMLSHLAVADLMVTFLMMPMEIGWAMTVAWKGGDLLCRLMSFFRTFGLFLSGFMVMCISLDRYFAVLHPLAMCDGNHRGRLMIATAWLASAVFSLPQVFVFSEMRHPEHPWYTQCVTFRVLPTHGQQVVYSVIGVVTMYIAPLVTIIFCYSAIILEICKRVVDTGSKLRRSNSANLYRAKIHTLKMTVAIVTMFIVCWTPYNIMLLWYWIDRSGASAVDQKVQKLLFLFGATNSSFNPLVYGIFSIKRPSSAGLAPPSTAKITTISRLKRPNSCEATPEMPQKMMQV